MEERKTRVCSSCTFGRTVAVVVCLMLGTGTLPKELLFADSQTETYQLHMPVPQVAQAANGEQVRIMGSGLFSFNPKSTNVSGTYTSGASGSGTWVATQLLSFVPYCCRPAPNEAFCGGKPMLRVLLTDATSGSNSKVFCRCSA